MDTTSARDRDTRRDQYAAVIRACMTRDEDTPGELANAVMAVADQEQRAHAAAALAQALDLAHEEAARLGAELGFEAAHGARCVAHLLIRQADEAAAARHDDGAGEPAELRALPREVRRLVHAVDRMRSSWAETAPDSQERRDLWTAVHTACDAAWERHHLTHRPDDTTGA